MGKSIIDKSPIPAQMAPSLFKFLLCVAPNLHDLELFDDTLALNLRSLLLRPMGQMELFDDDGTRLSDATKFVYVQQKVSDFLVGSREEQLRALKSGFDECGLSEALKVFSCTDLMVGVVTTNPLFSLHDVPFRLQIKKKQTKGHRALFFGPLA